jgi:glycosyltransferase involved in cell wall biosynthesis
MPVFNCRPYLAEAIASVLTQTFAGFELLIVDDGSTDGSAGIMDRAAAADGRIRVLRRANTGIVGALNEGVAAARGELLARMDGDDVALPGRFQAQVDFLLAHPECVAVGTAVEIIDSFGARVDRHHPPTGHVAIVADLLRGNGGALIHPSAVFRTGALHAVGGYDPAFGRAEDLDLYFRLGRYGQLANLAATGLRYRHHARSVSFHHRETQRDQVTRILTREFALRGMPAEPFALHGHTDLSAGQLHARYACTALAHGRRATAVRHGLCAVLHAGADHECWRALRYALTARPPSSRPVL